MDLEEQIIHAEHLETFGDTAAIEIDFEIAFHGVFPCDNGWTIASMPILDAAKAHQVFFVKRSMRPGYSGVDNLLFYQDNTSLVFGDAKDVCEGMVNALKGGGH